MKQLAEDVHVLEGFPPYAINVYLVGDVLVDAATRFAARRILRRLRGREISSHAPTRRPSWELLRRDRRSRALRRP